MQSWSNKIRMPRSHELAGRCQRIYNDSLEDDKTSATDNTDVGFNGELDTFQKIHDDESDIRTKEYESSNQSSPEISRGSETPEMGKCAIYKDGENNENINVQIFENKDTIDYLVPGVQKTSTYQDNKDEIMTYPGGTVSCNNDDSIKRKKAPIHVGKELSDHYKRIQLIGSGKFGKVYKVINKDTERLAAAKEIPYNNAKSKASILYEIDILSKLPENQYILNLFEVFDCCTSKPSKMIIITEYLDGGDLFTEIAEGDILTECKVIKLITQIVEGVLFIHDHGIIHRDLKPENIIYHSKSNDKIKIIDFGLAVLYDKTRPPKSMVGTTLFVAPEVLKFENQSYQTDIWSVGVIAFDLLTGITPFEIPRTGDLDRILTDEEIMVNIELCQYDFEDDGFIGVSEEAKSFISSILIIDPTKRLTASDCLKHSWLNDKDYVDIASTGCSVSVQRMKSYVALKKWEKLSLAIQSINSFKASLDHG